jgi:uncharacterized repeat protein (TIGR01451 family)
MTKLLNPALFVGLFFIGCAVAAPGSQNLRVPASAKAGAAAAEKSHNLKVGRPPARPNAAVSYNGSLSAADPTYNRTVEGCTSLSGVGTDVSYSAKTFTVDTAGNYDIESEQTGFDGMIFLYTGTFNPSSAVTNCTEGNDDSSGVGFSAIVGAPLVTGTSYTVVTTSFDIGETGTFTNTITGPGSASLPNLTLSKTAPNGVSTGNFSYQFDVANTGTTNETGVKVTDTLPAGLTYVSDTCGGSAVAGVWTWTIGASNQGTTATCTLTVSAGNVANCPAITNNASLVTDSGFTASASTNNLSDAVTDGGFEGGPGAGTWVEASDNFGTPLCDASCSQSPDNGPHSGSFWAWFGGVGDAPETGSLSQTLTIPNTATAITFWVDLTACNANQGAADFVRLTIDGTEVWREDATSPACGETTYHQVSIPLTTQADGNSHTIVFESEQEGFDDGEVTNLFIDDVSIALPPVCGAGQSDLIFANGFEAPTP